jgi:DNA-binding IclR family transcriptional regulator
MTVQNIKQKIIDILSKHPEGLIVNEISKILDIHRHTLTKYIYQLVGEQTIYQRKIGSAKLCCLRVENDRE